MDLSRPTNPFKASKSKTKVDRREAAAQATDETCWGKHTSRRDTMERERQKEGEGNKGEWGQNSMLRCSDNHFSSFAELRRADEGH